MLNLLIPQFSVVESVIGHPYEGFLLIVISPHRGNSARIKQKLDEFDKLLALYLINYRVDLFGVVEVEIFTILQL